MDRWMNRVNPIYPSNCAGVQLEMCCDRYKLIGTQHRRGVESNITSYIKESNP